MHIRLFNAQTLSVQHYFLPFQATCSVISAIVVVVPIPEPKWLSLEDSSVLAVLMMADQLLYGVVSPMDTRTLCEDQPHQSHAREKRFYQSLSSLGLCVTDRIPRPSLLCQREQSII